MKKILRQKPRHIVLGVTSHQTCMLIAPRAKALQTAGFKVSVLAGPGRVLDDWIRAEGFTAYEIPMCRGVSLWKDASALMHTCALLWKLKPDAVEFSTPKMGLIGTLAAWACRVPRRIYLLRGLRLETSGAVKRQVLKITERIAAACSHFVLCNSRSLRHRALEFRIARPSKLIVLGSGSSNGVDIGRFVPAASKVRFQFGIPPDASVIGFVGRLTGDKGLPELLEAFAKILRAKPDAYLLLVGWFDAAEDALERGFRERIESHPHVVITGYVADVAPFYQVMDLMVLPSWREGFPNAVLEAAASGVPVVSTFSTGARDAVIPEVTGLLVPPGYPDAICEACITLLQDDMRRARMGAAARDWAERYFAQDRVLSLTVDFYKVLTGEGRNAVPRFDEEAQASGYPVPL